MDSRRIISMAGALAVLVAVLPSQVAMGQDAARDVRMLPEVIPDELPNGTVETPMGTARWVHLSGTRESLPDPLHPTIGTSGLVWLEWGGTQYLPCQDPAQGRQCEVAVAPHIWTSEDALAPREEHELPIDAASAGLWLEGDMYWLTTTGPASLWRSSDLATWEELDTSALVSPGPVDLTWDVELGIPATSNGVSLVPVTYRATDLGRLVGLPGSEVHLETAGPGRFVVAEHHLRSEGGDKDAGYVQVEETPTGVRFLSDDGATIAEVAGAGLDMVERWASSGSIEERQLGILQGASLRVIDMPGDPGADPTGQGLTLFPVEAGFMAFQIDEDQTIRTWRSADGRTWAEGDRLSGPDGEPWKTEWVGATWLAGQHELTVTPLAEAGEDRQPAPWLSDDGVTWRRGEPPPNGEEGLEFPVPGGTLRFTDVDGSWSASTDGSTWQPVPGLRDAVTKWTPEGAGSAGGGTVGDALFFSVEEAEGTQQRDLWIIEFEPDAQDG